MWQRVSGKVSHPRWSTNSLANRTPIKRPDRTNSATTSHIHSDPKDRDPPPKSSHLSASAGWTADLPEPPKGRRGSMPRSSAPAHRPANPMALVEAKPAGASTSAADPLFVVVLDGVETLYGDGVRPVRRAQALGRCPRPGAVGLEERGRSARRRQRGRAGRHRGRRATGRMRWRATGRRLEGQNGQFTRLGPHVRVLNLLIPNGWWMEWYKR